MTVERVVSIRGGRVPRFLYGTAWKEERTRDLVDEALEVGFRGIDTANQLRHYREQAVGDAIAGAGEGSGPDREDLFLQTKFTHPAGQGDRPPYDPGARPAEQVRQSLRSSLRHLEVERVDSYLLHAPAQRPGLGEADREAWRAMEECHEAVRESAARHDRSVPQVIFRFALHLDMVPLTGTTDPEHMRQDLEVFEFDLEEDEVEAIELLAESSR